MCARVAMVSPTLQLTRHRKEKLGVTLWSLRHRYDETIVGYRKRQALQPQLSRIGIVRDRER